ncbi:aquaporin-5 [Platysternon megacephalum]|uniref:Aquaporin-5 n=1 Tax=Platysternon megacephalum TaxID=55544 RepID=A0A4D9EB11_9SAUR|nr:aquaporin-5 [Platysternon megacephalum]
MAGRTRTLLLETQALSRQCCASQGVELRLARRFFNFLHLLSTLRVRSPTPRNPALLQTSIAHCWQLKMFCSLTHQGLPLSPVGHGPQLENHSTRNGWDECLFTCGKGSCKLPLESSASLPDTCLQTTLLGNADHSNGSSKGSQLGFS